MIGCVIKGDTPHFDYVCQSVTQGITTLNVQGEIPVIFSVVTTLNIEQARDRAGGKVGNKGSEGALTAMQMACLVFGNTTNQKSHLVDFWENNLLNPPMIAWKAIAGIALRCCDEIHFENCQSTTNLIEKSLH